MSNKKGNSVQEIYDIIRVQFMRKRESPLLTIEQLFGCLNQANPKLRRVVGGNPDGLRDYIEANLSSVLSIESDGQRVSCRDVKKMTVDQEPVKAKAASLNADKNGQAFLVPQVSTFQVASDQTLTHKQRNKILEDFANAEPPPSTERYDLENEKKAILFILAIFHTRGRPDMGFEDINKLISRIPEENIVAYIGKHSGSRLKFLEKRSHIFSLVHEKGMICLRPRSIVDAVYHLNIYVRRMKAHAANERYDQMAGGRTFEEARQFFLHSKKGISNDARSVVGEKPGDFLAFLQEHKWIFSLGFNNTQVSSCRELIRVDYKELETFERKLPMPEHELHMQSGFRSIATRTSAVVPSVDINDVSTTTEMDDWEAWEAAFEEELADDVVGSSAPQCPELLNSDTGHSSSTPGLSLDEKKRNGIKAEPPPVLPLKRPPRSAPTCVLQSQCPELLPSDTGHSSSMPGLSLDEKKRNGIEAEPPPVLPLKRPPRSAPTCVLQSQCPELLTSDTGHSSSTPGLSLDEKKRNGIEAEPPPVLPSKRLPRSAPKCVLESKAGSVATNPLTSGDATSSITLNRSPATSLSGSQLGSACGTSVTYE